MKKNYILPILLILASLNIFGQNQEFLNLSKKRGFKNSESPTQKRSYFEEKATYATKAAPPKGNHPQNVVDTLLPPVFGMSCYTTDPSPLTIYSSSNGGYVAGNNGYGDLEKAQLYSIANTSTVTGTLVYIGKKKNTSNSGIAINIYDRDVSTGAPGNLLGTSDMVNIGAVDTASLTYFNFSTPVPVGTEFFVSVILPGAAGDTIGIVSTKSPCHSSTDLSYEMWNDFSWTSIAAAWSINIDLVILPIVDMFVPMEDASVIDIPSPRSGCNLSNKELVKVTVKNTGTGALSSIPVAYRVDANPAVTETFNISLNPNDTATYTFSARADLSLGGAHTIYVYTDLANDGARGNDTMYTYGNNAISTDLSSPIVMGFEPTDDLVGWTYSDADKDGTSWQIYNTTVHGGTQCIVKFGSGHNDNDWLFTKCMDLKAGTTYKLEYYYKNFNKIAACRIESRVGTTADSTMAQIIVTNPLPTGSDTAGYVFSSNNFTVPVNGVYYVAFRAFSTAGTGSSSMRLDDINLSIDLTIGIGENVMKNGIKFYPNPSSGIVKVSNEMRDDVYSLRVLNTMGQEVMNKSFRGNMDQTLDLSACSNGVYLVEIKSSKEVLKQKIFISK